MLRLVVRRLRALFRRDRLESELDEEVRFHLEREVEYNRALGMGEAEARAAALRSFGGVERFKEDARDARGVRLLEETWQDVRYGLRMMRKAPGFTAVAVVSLALGVGANTALFSVLDAVLLETLPVKEPERLVLFEWESGTAFRPGSTRGYGNPNRPPGTRGSSSFHYRVFEELRGKDGALSDLIAFANLWEVNVSANGEAEIADGQVVSGRYFAALGVPALLGRTLTAADDDPAAAPAAVISYPFWQTRFGGDPKVLGREVEVNKVAFTVVGVTPPGFTGTLQVDTRPVVTVPIAFEPAVSGKGSSMARPDARGVWFVHLMGRLKPGATLEQAREELDGTFQAVALELMPPPAREGEIAASQLDPKDHPRLVAHSGSRGMLETRERYSSTITILFGVVGLVLLVACANVANMLLSRSAARAAEITVRLAVGAGRLRLVRQLLTESLLLSALAGAAGVLLAVWGRDALAALGEQQGGLLPAGVEYDLNWRVLAFAVGVSLLTAVVFGVAPALRATGLDLTTALKESNRVAGGVSRSRLSKALVVAQIATSLLLLVGAGLFIRTVQNLEHVDAGFDQERLLVFSLRPRTLGYDGARLEQLYRDLFARLEAIPGVRSATFARVPLLADTSHNTNVILPGETERSEAEHIANRQIVRENYFETMEVPILRGRAFTERDAAGAQRAAIVSEEFVRRYLPGVDPIGQRVGLDAETVGQIEIVGVARDTKYNSPREGIEPLLYTPWLQETDNIGSMSFALRASGDPMALGPAVREAVRGVDPAIPVADLTTQETQASRTFAGERLFAALLSFFGALALLLAAVGLYGVMAYSVSQRTNEIGIRMALGAAAASVLRLVVWQGLKFAVVGLAVGAVAAVALERVVRSRLYEVGAADPVVFAVVGLLLLGVALLACLVPARRATKVDPVIALRQD